jgi:hypothetical protein
MSALETLALARRAARIKGAMARRVDEGRQFAVRRSDLRNERAIGVAYRFG